MAQDRVGSIWECRNPAGVVIATITKGWELYWWHIVDYRNGTTLMLGSASTYRQCREECPIKWRFKKVK